MKSKIEKEVIDEDSWCWRFYLFFCIVSNLNAIFIVKINYENWLMGGKIEFSNLKGGQGYLDKPWVGMGENYLTWMGAFW